MSEEKDTITLYPSNWLYNAGVVGFLICLDREDYLQKENNYNNVVKYEIKNDDSLTIYKSIFGNININENYFENGKVVNLKGKNQYYPNFIDATGNQKPVFKAFVKAFANNEKHSKIDCPLCKNGLLVNEQQIDNSEQKTKFFNKIDKLNMVHNKLLGPSELFPNSYWNFNTGFKICHLCTFLLIHHHLALTKLSDGSEIFINAYSFKVMYELNKIVKEAFGKGEDGTKHKREILAMSIIEYARRIQTTLGMWNAMNIEIVTKQNNIIDFYSLPYEVVNLISDRAIASLLSDIGEFYVLNLILDEKYQELLDLSQKLIKISIKDETNKADRDFLNAHLKQEKNKINLSTTAQKILKLYATIIDRRKTYVRSAN